VDATQTHQLSAVIEDDLEQVLRRAEPALRRLAGRTVVVAGGAGFLPSYLVDALARANDRLLEDPCR
jgi:dihydrofolate reductase